MTASIPLISLKGRRLRPIELAALRRTSRSLPPCNFSALPLQANPRVLSLRNRDREKVQRASHYLLCMSNNLQTAHRILLPILRGETFRLRIDAVPARLDRKGIASQRKWRNLAAT